MAVASRHVEHCYGIVLDSEYCQSIIVNEFYFWDLAYLFYGMSIVAVNYNISQTCDRQASSEARSFSLMTDFVINGWLRPRLKKKRIY